MGKRKIQKRLGPYKKIAKQCYLISRKLDPKKVVLLYYNYETVLEGVSDKKIYFELIHRGQREYKSKLQQLPYKLDKIDRELKDKHPTFGYEIVDSFTYPNFNFNQVILSDLELKILRALTGSKGDGIRYETGVSLNRLTKLIYPNTYDVWEVGKPNRKKYLKRDLKLKQEVADAFNRLSETGLVCVTVFGTLWYTEYFVRISKEQGFYDELDKVIVKVKRRK